MERKEVGTRIKAVLTPDDRINQMQFRVTGYRRIRQKWLRILNLIKKRAVARSASRSSKKGWLRRFPLFPKLPPSRPCRLELLFQPEVIRDESRHHEDGA